MAELAQDLNYSHDGLRMRFQKHPRCDGLTYPFSADEAKKSRCRACWCSVSLRSRLEASIKAVGLASFAYTHEYYCTIARLNRAHG